MGKASSSKKVARIARTGGGRTRRGSASWVWPTAIVFIVVVGTGLVVFSKSDQSSADSTAPRVGGKDHWHAALGFDICGEFLPPITDQTDPLGIHTHGDGVVHIHPFSQTAAGKNATLGKYFDAVQAEVSDSEIKLPGQPAKKNGQKCGDQEARVQVRTWDSKAPDAPSSIYTGNPSDLRPNDGQLVTIAFVPEGAEIRRPPSTDNLDKLTDVPGATTPTPPGSVPGAPTPDPTQTTPPADPAQPTPPADATQPTPTPETTPPPAP